MSDYESKASTPKAFEDVGRIKASEFYALAGLFRQMPEVIRQRIEIALMTQLSVIERSQLNQGNGLLAHDGLRLTNEYRALLEAIRE